MRRRRSVALAASALAALAALGASTQQWLAVSLQSGAALSVAGSAAAPSIAPVSLAVVALAAAASLARRRGLRVLGSIQVLLAAALLSAGISPLLSPGRAVAASVTASTGVAGNDAVAGLLASVVPTPWIGVALVAALIVGVLGVIVVGRARAWSSAPGRPDGEAARDAPISDPQTAWDALSTGDDPTEPFDTP